jgi:intracellular septation protein
MSVSESPKPAEKTTTKPASWIRPTVEYGPVIVFVVVLKIWGLMPATAVLIVASVLAVAFGYIRERRVALAPVVTTVLVVIFGGLTLIFHDEFFIKIKPTVVYVLFAVTLWTGLLLKKPLLERLIGGSLKMDHLGWRKLEGRYACFCAGMAVLNEIVWRTQTTDTWGNFKLGSIPLTILFMATQLPMIRRHMLPDPVEAEGK